jgi:hypothetical protein
MDKKITECIEKTTYDILTTFKYINTNVYTVRTHIIAMLLYHLELSPKHIFCQLQKQFLVLIY